MSAVNLEGETQNQRQNLNVSKSGADGQLRLGLRSFLVRSRRGSVVGGALHLFFMLAGFSRAELREDAAAWLPFHSHFRHAGSCFCELSRRKTDSSSECTVAS